jgi:hypothetical protein
MPGAGSAISCEKGEWPSNAGLTERMQYITVGWLNEQYVTTLNVLLSATPWIVQEGGEIYAQTIPPEDAT